MYTDLLLKEMEYLSKIPVDRISGFVQTIEGYAKNHTRIITSGMGKAGQIAHTFSTTLSSTGTPSYFLHPAEAQHGDLGLIGEDDILIIFSNSGKTREVLELIDLSRNLNPELKILSIVGESNEELDTKTNFVLKFGPVEEICPLGLTPTTSTTCMSVICDLIVVGLMRIKDFTKNEYSKRHHGGYLGKKSKD